MLPAIDRLNAMPDGDAAATLGAFFENAPGFVRRVCRERPFSSYEQLIERAEEMAATLPEDEQLEVINGHPRIGAEPSSVSAQSYREQGYDRVAQPGEDGLAERLAQLNAEYERRFGFRFCIFVAGRPRSEVADIMSSRLNAQREEELARALSDVFAIARSRLVKLSQPLEEVR